MKVCIDCNIEKEYKDFYKRKDNKDGYRNNCKECMKIRTKSNRELILSTEEGRNSFDEKRKEYYNNNKEEILKNRADYCRI